MNKFDRKFASILTKKSPKILGLVLCLSSPFSINFHQC